MMIEAILGIRNRRATLNSNPSRESNLSERSSKFLTSLEPVSKNDRGSCITKVSWLKFRFGLHTITIWPFSEPNMLIFARFPTTLFNLLFELSVLKVVQSCF